MTGIGLHVVRAVCLHHILPCVYGEVCVWVTPWTVCRLFSGSEDVWFLPSPGVSCPSFHPQDGCFPDLFICKSKHTLLEIRDTCLMEHFEIQMIEHCVFQHCVLFISLKLMFAKVN